MKAKPFYIIFLSFISWQLSAQELLPFVENFGKSIYRGDNQIWNIVQGNDQAMYFANNSYLLRYDGVCWERYHHPNKTYIRAILADADRIYSGSYQEFGYWIRKEAKMHYVSLTKGKKLLDADENNEISKIFKFGGQIYFQSQKRLYTFNGKVLKVLKMPLAVSNSFVVGDQLWITDSKKTVFCYSKNRLEKLDGLGQLEVKELIYIAEHQAKIYLFTRNAGVFVYENKQLRPWNSSFNAFLKNSNLNIALFVREHQLIVGTEFKGASLFDLQTGTHKNFNRSNALLNNAVLSVAQDRDKDIWLGLENGISHLEVNSNVSLFYDSSGSLGSVYSLCRSEKGYLIGSNRGVFRLEDKKMSLVPNTQGQVWNITAIGTQYLIGHQQGTYLYKDAMLRRLNAVEKGSNLVKSSIDQSYLQAASQGVVIYDNPANVAQHTILKEIGLPIRYVAQDRKNEFWAASEYKGLFRIRYDDSYDRIVVDSITKDHKIENDYGVKIIEFRKEILFLINNSWYTYNYINDKLESNALFNANFKEIDEITSLDENRLLLLKEGILYYIIANGNRFLKYSIPEKYYKGRLINGHLKVVKDGTNYLLNLDDGFISLTLPFRANSLPQIKIEAFSNDRLLENRATIERNSNLKLHIITGKYGVQKPELFYSLNSSDVFNSIKGGIIPLSNLDSGSYMLSIYAYDGLNYHRLTSYEFEVAKAWYLSIGMMLFYLLLVGFILYVYFKWNKLRTIQKLYLQKEELKHQQALLEMELKAEHELSRQEYENHILQLELHSKSLEIASKSLSIAKQSEMIENIQNILETELDENKLKSEIRKAIKINAVNKHQWEVFESNLSLVNNEFIVALSKKYPHLTSKDIKLCVYLKMNLSSKEIAPMMNISFRGVELHRYRLRKKLKLSPTESLSMFLLSL